MNILRLSAACLLAVTPLAASAQAACKGAALAGSVVDPTGAIVSGASVSLESGQSTTAASDGHFRFACVPSGAHHLTVAANSFAPRTVDLIVPLRRSPLSITLQPETVQTTVDVAADSGDASSPTAAGASQTISGEQLASLPDDPDDLLLQLQQLAAAGGGNPANATIAVDGFQDSTKIPPKSSIAYIKVNPDLFSAEYREPPFEGGRVEIYTKPGQSAFHGALFTTNDSPWMNARDPFSLTRAPLGKQRYGFELNGPIRRKGSDFTMTLEHRSIDNYAVVNAITLNSAGSQVNTVANVSTPQRLWEGTARVDWQLGPKNTFIANYSANVNHLSNVGVGGTALAETGYDSGQYEHILRLTDVTTASPRLMHEARVSLRWDGENDAPNSTAPQVQVAGAFTGGGATTGAQQIHRFVFEVDDDAILSLKKHLLKFGTQLLFYSEHNQLTTNFNGTYTFGGGLAPLLGANSQPTGASDTITGLEQYRRAVLHLPGGAPTAFSNVAGTPRVDFTQLGDSLFFQDDWKLRPNLHIAMGMRYFLQNNPNTYNGATPRLGISWSPDKKATWNLHGHAGLFTGRYAPREWNELLRMDGVHRITSTVYNPSCAAITAAAGCDPFAGATSIRSLRTTSPHLSNISFAIENVGFTKSFPHGWNLSGDAFIARIWNFTRSRNINTPFNGSPTGPRPGPANLNILQMDNSGQGGGNAQFASLEQHSFKRIQFMMGVVRVDIFDDTNDSSTFTPQSAYTNAGEFARRTDNPLWNLFGSSTVKLPLKLQLNDALNMSGAATYNITTGFDNNGDGEFNDRPGYAAPGDPNAMSTRFGRLVNTGGIAPLPRNKGIMPWTAFLNANLQRTFTLSHNAKADHQQTLVANIRSVNALNHTNVKQVGGVLGSPLFGIPYAADTGRRIEAGLRYSF